MCATLGMSPDLRMDLCEKLSSAARAMSNISHRCSDVATSSRCRAFRPGIATLSSKSEFAFTDSDAVAAPTIRHATRTRRRMPTRGRGRRRRWSAVVWSYVTSRSGLRRIHRWRRRPVLQSVTTTTEDGATSSAIIRLRHSHLSKRFRRADRTGESKNRDSTRSSGSSRRCDLRTVAREVAANLARKRPSPLLRGHCRTGACGITASTQAAPPQGVESRGQSELGRLGCVSYCTESFQSDAWWRSLRSSRRHSHPDSLPASFGTPPAACCQVSR